MKEAHKQKKKDPSKLFCPGYKASKENLQQYSKIAKKFIKIIMSVISEIEKFETTPEFNNRIAIAETSMVDPAQERLVFIREVKASALQKQLDRIVKELHLDESISQKKLHQLRQEIAFSYSDTLLIGTGDQSKTFEKKLNSIVSKILRDVSYCLTNQGDEDVHQPNKYKKLEL